MRHQDEGYNASAVFFWATFRMPSPDATPELPSPVRDSRTDLARVVRLSPGGIPAVGDSQWL